MREYRSMKDHCGPAATYVWNDTKPSQQILLILQPKKKLNKKKSKRINLAKSETEPRQGRILLENRTEPEVGSGESGPRNANEHLKSANDKRQMWGIRIRIPGGKGDPKRVSRGAWAPVFDVSNWSWFL